MDRGSTGLYLESCYLRLVPLAKHNRCVVWVACLALLERDLPGHVDDLIRPLTFPWILIWVRHALRRGKKADLVPAVVDDVNIEAL